RFFFSSRRRHTRFSRDWSSDVCSSDLRGVKRMLKPENLRPEGRCPATQRTDVRGQPPEKRAPESALVGRLGLAAALGVSLRTVRSEERRVGGEWRSARWPGQWQRNRGE